MLQLNGLSLTKSFLVNICVKCSLKYNCPVLFSLYLNDIVDVVPGGVYIADSPIVLQSMINSVYNYYLRWKLSVNLNKSKIMTFRRATKISNHFCNSDAVIFNSYKYLGVDNIFNLSFKKLLVNRL